MRSLKSADLPKWRRKEYVMGLSVSSALSIASLAAANSSPASESAAHQPAQRTANQSADTVQLSEAQQVYNLYNQGQTVPQIADNLNLTENDVNSFLGLTKSSSS
jgi:DNA-binding NarL/FixJ family response regulator